MADEMSVEQPKPKLDQAERWLRVKGVQEPEAPKAAPVGLFGKIKEGFRTGETNQTRENLEPLLPEAYDLFVEKEDLKHDIVRKQREVMEPKAAAPALTFEQKREAIRQGKIGDLLSSVSSAEPYGEVVGKSQARIQEIDSRVDQIFSQPGMYDRVREDLRRQVGIRHQAREVRSIDRFAQQADLGILKLTREAQVQGRALTTVERKFIEESQTLVEDARERRQELLKAPEVFDRVRIMELQEYKRQMKRDRFAETPSRKEYLKKIEAYWAEAKKVLLTGETGTGKTEMIKHASNVLFGVNPEPVTGHQDMSIYELLGKTGFRVQEGDVFRPAPLVRAMTGRDGKGQPFLFDEIDRAPNQAIMGIKTILNARPGEKGIKVQTDSAGSFDVGADYAVAATANIKSEKYTTATELDPAIVRVFDAPMDVDYIPSYEVYDLALASLMDARGGVPLSEGDARAVLKNLCDAASWIQDAYQGRRVVTDPSSGSILEARGQASTDKPASLKKALLDPGRTLDMLKGWSAAQVKGTSFEDFLNQRIIEFINNRAYSEEDRYYLTEIFALKGFLRGHKANELMVAELNQDTLDRWSGATGRRAAKSGKEAYLPADRVARLDPYRRFKRPVSADAEELLEEELTSESVEEDQTISSEATPLYSGLTVVPDNEARDVLRTLNRMFPKLPATLPERAEYIGRITEIMASNSSAEEIGIRMIDQVAEDSAVSIREASALEIYNLIHPVRNYLGKYTFDNMNPELARQMKPVLQKFRMIRTADSSSAWVRNVNDSFTKCFEILRNSIQ